MVLETWTTIDPARESNVLLIMPNGDPIMVLGWIATVTAVLMYVSYIPQIHLNWRDVRGR